MIIVSLAMLGMLYGFYMKSRFGPAPLSPFTSSFGYNTGLGTWLTEQTRALEGLIIQVYIA